MMAAFGGGANSAPPGPAPAPAPAPKSEVDWNFFPLPMWRLEGGSGVFALAGAVVFLGKPEEEDEEDELLSRFPATQTARVDLSFDIATAVTFSQASRPGRNSQCPSGAWDRTASFEPAEIMKVWLARAKTVSRIPH